MFPAKQKHCITFVQRWPNVFDVGPALYKCYTNVLCLLVLTLPSKHQTVGSMLDEYLLPIRKKKAESEQVSNESIGCARKQAHLSPTVTNGLAYLKVTWQGWRPFPRVGNRSRATGIACSANDPSALMEIALNCVFSCFMSAKNPISTDVLSSDLPRRKSRGG